MKHVAVFAGIMLVLGMVGFVTGPKMGIPWWWTAGELAAGIPAVLLGGWLRARGTRAREAAGSLQRP